MAGCRNLTSIEIEKVTNALKNDRDKTLFILGYTTGFRISELLSLKIKHVYDFDVKAFNEFIKIEKQDVKGKTESKTKPLDNRVKVYLFKLVTPFLDIHFKDYPLFKPSAPNVKNIKAISRIAAHNILKNGYIDAGLTGNLSTHSMRKSFAMRFYKESGNDLFLLQKALNHSSILTTIKYLPSDDEAINNIIKKINN